MAHGPIGALGARTRVLRETFDDLSAVGVVLPDKQIFGIAGILSSSLLLW